jgi:MoaA/NifB/PqqE/SkfB family radical SAM enzyme
MDLEIRAAAPATPALTAAVASLTFADILRYPDIAGRFRQVRSYFFLRESTYDMTSRCNVRCDGCYYYEGDKQNTQDNVDVEAWRNLFRAEKARGITFVVLAGAEPALVPALLETCYAEIPLGAIASNGLIRIPESVGYRIHISVWGNDATSQRVRKATRMLERQMEAYAGDPRAVFVYTFTRENLSETPAVIETLAKRGCKVTFNMFSSTVGYHGPLAHTAESLAETRRTMLQMLAEYPEHILFSPYSAAAHTDALSLHDLFSCPYPRQNAGQFGLGRSFRQYRSDLTWVREASCCVPDTDCADCRHYAAGSAIVTARMNRHITSPDQFRGWLDYVDTYLAVWIQGYAKNPNLGAASVLPSLARPAASAVAARPQGESR